MEFNVDLNSFLRQVITRTVGGRLPQESNVRATQSENEQVFAAIVDEVGMASARAQGLRAPITTFQKLKSSNHVLYILKDPSGRGAVVGILKLGRKRLFLSDLSGGQHEVEPLCVLDFYVHESRQRSGCGKKLFEAMLQFERVRPQELAIDRPSPKFLNFLKKHYKLQSFTKQANNFVVFDRFFSNCDGVGSGTRRLSLRRQGRCLSDSGDGGRFSPSSPHTPQQQVPWKRLSAPFGGEEVGGRERRAHFKERCIPSAERLVPSKAHQSEKAASECNKNVISSPNLGRVSGKGPRAGAPSSSEFNWSPDCVLRQPSRVTNGPNSARSRGINIITGAPAPTGGQYNDSSCDTNVQNLADHGQRVSGRVGARGKEDTGGGSLFATVTNDRRAPYLTMRSHEGKSVAGHRSTTVQPPGFHTAVTMAVGSGRTMNSRFGYSRHGAMEGGHFSAGLSGTSLVSHASHVTRLNAEDKPKSKPSDKWKTYIT